MPVCGDGHETHCAAAHQLAFRRHVHAATHCADGGGQAFSKEELEQIVAPIALYPDPLVAQVLMASTYPLEVMTAARWVKANPGLKGKALEDALQSQAWDPSVKALTAMVQGIGGGGGETRSFSDRGAASRASAGSFGGGARAGGGAGAGARAGGGGGRGGRR